MVVKFLHLYAKIEKKISDHFLKILKRAYFVTVNNEYTTNKSADVDWTYAEFLPPIDLAARMVAAGKNFSLKSHNHISIAFQERESPTASSMERRSNQAPAHYSRGNSQKLSSMM